METNTVVTPAANAATTFKAGEKFVKTIKGFSYGMDWAFLTVDIDGKNQSIIIGDKHSYPIQQLIGLKGLSVEFTFNQYVTKNGNTYPQFRLECITL
jgi:hypothetical protein